MIINIYPWQMGFISPLMLRMGISFYPQLTAEVYVLPKKGASGNGRKHCHGVMLNLGEVHVHHWYEVPLWLQPVYRQCMQR